MADRATGINPEMLRWAREQAGYPTVESVASRLKRPVADIEAWESGSQFPTWRQLERVARNVYRRPTAIFFLPSPPSEKTPVAEFQRLPKAAIEDLEPDTWFALRQAKARRFDLEELAQFDDSKERLILGDFAQNADNVNAADLAAGVRKYLHIKLESQLGWQSERVALENWRNAIQEAGVWVFKRPFIQSDIAGFCLYDRRQPLIYLNRAYSIGRQMLTLFNQLAHLLFKFSHLERWDIGHYIGSLEGDDRDAEDICSRVASEVLIPTKHFLENVTVGAMSVIDELVLMSVARKYRVGKEVALRKYLDQGFIDLWQYNEKVKEWNEAELAAASKSGGGNYYAIQRANLGTKYTGLVFRGFYQGAYEVDQLVEYLGVRTSNVANLESWLHRSIALR